MADNRRQHLKLSVKHCLNNGIDQYFRTRMDPIAVTVKDRHLESFFNAISVSNDNIDRERITFTATLKCASNYLIKADKDREIDGRVAVGGAAGGAAGAVAGGGAGAAIGGLIGIIGGPIGVGIGVAIGAGAGAAVGGVTGAGGGAGGTFRFRKTVQCTAEHVFTALGTITDTGDGMISITIEGPYVME